MDFWQKHLEQAWLKSLNASPALTPTLLNSWVNYAGWCPAQYFKDPHGFVYLRGLICNGTLDTVCMTLPLGYRPDNSTLMFGTMGGANYARIDVDGSSGNVTVRTTSNAWVSLSGICFYAGL